MVRFSATLFLASLLLLSGQDLPQPSSETEEPAAIDATLFGDPSATSPTLETDPAYAQLVSQADAWQPKAAEPAPAPDGKNKPRAKEDEFKGPTLGKLKFETQISGEANPFGDVDLSRWRRDPRGAMRQANEERKLMLLWFTNSKFPGCSHMGTEVFEHTDFLRAAKDNVVRVRVDYGEPDVASHPYARLLESASKVHGYPHLILYSPEKQKLWEHRGYRQGQFTVLVGELESQIQHHVAREKARLNRLLAEGYREWNNFRSQTIFAKPVGLSRETKMVSLQMTSGTRTPYPVIYLSDPDRAWLAEKMTEFEAKSGLSSNP